MRVLVTGVNGQLGHDAVNELLERGFDVYASDITDEYKGIIPIEKSPYIQMDITDKESVKRAFSISEPDAVLHAAAWTAVDLAEDAENKDKVYRINSEGTLNIARECKAYNAKMLYISTDYVFSGRGDKPWSADDDSFDPVNVYGDSKLKGELAVRESLDTYFIVRIAWVFGINGKNFIKTMLKLSDTHKELRVVNDQIGTPTYTYDLSKLLADMLESNKYGIYNATNEGGYISWAEFAEEIMKEAHKDTRIVPVTTAEYGVSKAKRPYNSRLDKSKLDENGFKRLPDWKDALKRYLKELKRWGI